MLTILVAGGCWLLSAAVAVGGAHVLLQRARRRHRRRLSDAAWPRVETVFRANPAGPAQDALRSAQLRLMLDKSEPRA